MHGVCGPNSGQERGKYQNFTIDDWKLYASEAQSAQVVIGDGAGYLRSGGAFLRTLLKPTGERLKDGTDQAVSRDGRIGNKKLAGKLMQRPLEGESNLLGLVAENGAANMLQTRAEAGGFNDQNARVAGVFGEKKKERFNGKRDTEQRIGLADPGVLENLRNLIAERFKNRRKNIFLVAEVGVETAHGAFRFRNDHWDGGGVVAIAAKKPGGCIKDGAATGIFARGCDGAFSVDHATILFRRRRFHFKNGKRPIRDRILRRSKMILLPLWVHPRDGIQSDSFFTWTTVPHPFRPERSRRICRMDNGMGGKRMKFGGCAISKTLYFPSSRTT
jgi:hypothetical protein